MWCLIVVRPLIGIGLDGEHGTCIQMIKHRAYATCACSLGALGFRVASMGFYICFHELAFGDSLLSCESVNLLAGVYLARRLQIELFIEFDKLPNRVTCRIREFPAQTPFGGGKLGILAPGGQIHIFMGAC